MNLYECEMMFVASVGFREINDFMSKCGCGASLVARDALTFTVTQTLVEIPDENYLLKVAEILKDGYKTKKINVIECRFCGYKNIRIITPKEAENIAE